MPYKSSNLAIPPTPFSPQLPVTPPPANAGVQGEEKPAQRGASTLLQRAPPANPLKWLWQCHVCNRVYQLGVTRRCLDDGHHFCAGTTTVRKNKRTGALVKKHRACASEFDYSGWKRWSVWRREAAHAHRSAKTRKDCWKSCDYPSECRWGRQYGITVEQNAPNQDIRVESATLQLAAVALRNETTHTLSEGKPGGEEQIPSPLASEAPTEDEVNETARQRKRRSHGRDSSPLAAADSQQNAADVLERTDVRQPGLLPDEDDTGAAAATGRRTQYLQQALIDLGKSLGRVQNWATGSRREDRTARQSNE